MREIEVKASIDSIQTIIDALAAQGVAVSEPVTQHDRVYGLPEVDGEGDNTAPWLRIRSETKHGQTTHIFTLKRSVTSQLDSIEYETEVADESELEMIIKQLSFSLYSDLTKTRQKAHFGNIEVCIDMVEGLGSFIEVEKLTDESANIDEVRAELWQILHLLGVESGSEVTDGYDVLMNRKLSVA